MDKEISFWEAIKIMSSSQVRVTCRCVFGNGKEYSYQIHNNKFMYFNENEEKYIPSSMTIQDGLYCKWYLV